MYFCCNCKKVCESVEDLLFIEESSSRSFCSEKCIEEFYTPLIEYYAQIERALRKDFDCFNEDCLSYLNDPKNIEIALARPDEIWRIENALGDEVYSFTKEFSDDNGEGYFIAILCMLFNNRPSFIFMATATRRREFLAEFTIGAKIEDIADFLDIASDTQVTSPGLDQERLNFLEQKKSTLLAQLLDDRKDADIEYEQFHLYDEFFQDTLDSPDEIYSMNTDDGDEMFVYIKTNDRDGVSFYYIVICVRLPDVHELMLPVLSFPTLDPELCELYRKGQRVSGNLIN